MGLHETIYNRLVRKNENVQKEYERYVMEHTIQHYESRLKHWKILAKLKWHYQIRKKQEPMLYFDELSKRDIKKEIKPNESQSIKEKCNKENMQVIPMSNRNYRLQPHWLAKKLLSYDVVSFDIFDTLIFRPIKKPQDVFLLVGEKLKIIEFTEIRVNAEKKIREIHRAKYGNHEVTLEQIYREIEHKTGLPVEVGMKAEIETEYELVYPNPYMKCVFDILKSLGKEIVAVSDMYLSKEVIKSFLKKCGYEIDEIYVSCEYSCNKRNCGLYKQVLAKHSKKKIIHIGDNYKSDIENAKKMGMEVSFYRNCLYIGEDNYKIEGMSELVGSVYTGLVYNTVFNGKYKFNPYFEYGYLYGGLYIVGFCNWIKQQVKEDDVQKIIFLSRDGYIYQKVFDLISNDIDTLYMYWSRIASVISNIENNRYDFLKRLVDHKAVSVKLTKIKEILDIIGVSAQDIKLHKYGLNENMVLCNENKSFFENVLVDNIEVILKKNQNRDIQVKRMLEKIIGKSKKIAIVDVGWTGTSGLTLKYLIEQKYNLDCEVVCYLAASKVKNNVSNLLVCMKNEIKTYMFSQIKNRKLYDYHAQINKGTNSIYFELFTQACAPSFKGVSEDGSFEFDVAEVENYKMIQEIHKGILFFAKQYLAIAEKFPVVMNIPGNDAYIPYQHISREFEYIKKYFKEFSYARGVGGNMEIETIEDIIKSVGLL